MIPCGCYRAVYRLFPFFILVFLFNAHANDRLDSAVRLFEEGRLSESREILEQYTDDNPLNGRVAFYMGRICLNEENLDEAIDWFKKAVKADENNSENHHWLGNAYGLKARTAGLLKRGRLARLFKQEVTKAIALDPDNADARFSLFNYYFFAPRIGGGSKKKAREQAEEVRKRDPLLGRRAFALIYEDEEQYDLAEREYLQAIDENLDTVELYFALASFYTRIERPEDAFRTYENLVASNPDEIGVYYQIGRLGAITGQNLERSEMCLKIYLQHEMRKDLPSHAWAHYRLGMVYEKKGHTELAHNAYQAALALDPNHEEAKKALNR